MMDRSLFVGLAALGGLLILGGCAGNRAPGIAAAASQDHTTAATGYGLGPQNFNSNGGAFGPDQASGGH